MDAAQSVESGAGERLLGAGGPEPVEVVRPDATSPFFLTCEHAGRAFPARLGTLGLSGPGLGRHVEREVAFMRGQFSLAFPALAHPKTSGGSDAE